MANDIFNLPLVRRETVVRDTMSFWLDTSRVDYQFTAGQNAGFTIIDPSDTDEKGNTRTFSIACAPFHRGEYIMFASRMRNSAFKRELARLPIGTPLMVTGAMGEMTLPDDQIRPVVMLAGGIGITPFRAIIESAAHEGWLQDMTLVYSNHTVQGAAFVADLEDWSRSNRHFSLIQTLTRDTPGDWPHERGRINGEMIHRHIKDINTPIYFLAGPPQFVTNQRLMLLNLGVSMAQIKSESFTGYESGTN